MRFWFEEHCKIIFLLCLIVSDHALMSQSTDPQLSRCSPDLLQFRRHRYLFHLCRNEPGVAVTAVHGLKEAVSECQNQMRFDRWDCMHNIPATGTSHYTLLHEPNIVKYGYRETSFLVALSSAGVAWSVARSCSAGKLSACSCHVSQHAIQQKWEWGGCSYNVKYGLITSRRLLSRKKMPHKRGLTKIVYKHNLKAGRMAVKKTVAQACKCHGVSGSCQLKTCWKATANLNKIGQSLKESFQSAKFILHNNSPNDSRFSIVRAKSSELVYYEESPSFCHKNRELQTQGTSGRICSVRNGTSTVGNCDRLCCGRGWYTSRQQTQRDCNCRFVWCCRVECDTCTHTHFVSKCL